MIFPVWNCGILDVYYLPYVPDSSVQVSLNTNATIQLPGISSVEYPYFSRFEIYYRIYISGIETGEKFEPDNIARMGEINSSLATDFGMIKTDKTGTTTINTTTVGTTFSTRKYYKLGLENYDINDMLKSSGNLTLDFPSAPGSIPNLGKGGTSYPLMRLLTENGVYPKPDNRYFQNDSDLYDSTNATTSTINPDVADSAVPASPRWTYVSMYIVATGFDASNLNTIYSIPTFIGIFKLPNPY